MKTTKEQKLQTKLKRLIWKAEDLIIEMPDTPQKNILNSTLNTFQQVVNGIEDADL